MVGEGLVALLRLTDLVALTLEPDILFSAAPHPISLSTFNTIFLL